MSEPLDLESLSRYMGLKVSVEPSEDGTNIVYTFDIGNCRYQVAVPDEGSQSFADSIAEGTRRARKENRKRMLAVTDSVLVEGFGTVRKGGV